MKLLTASGDYAIVRERGWPLAGMQNPDLVSNQRHVIPLATAPGGPPDLATYARIYKSNPWVFAAVNAITFGLSRMGLNTFAYTGQDGDFDRVYGMLPGTSGRPSAGAALDKLLQMPEPGVGRHEWVRKIWIDKLVYGNALVVMDRSTATGIPTALWHIPWKRVVIREGTYLPIVSYEVQADHGSKFIDPADVIHFGRGANIDSPLGLSPIESLRYTVALHDAIQRHLVSYFTNSARPSGVLKVQPGTNKDTQALIQEQVRAMYASPEQAGKIMVTSGDWQQISADPQSSQIMELVKHSREEIAAVYRVPPPVLGILDRAIRSNVIELRSQFIRDVVGPEADSFECDVNAQLIQSTPALAQAGLFVNFDLDASLRPDLEARAGVYEQMRSVLTPNEMRKMELRKPLTGDAGYYADTVSLPSGQVFLGRVQPQEGNSAAGQSPGGALHPGDPKATAADGAPEGAPTPAADADAA